MVCGAVILIDVLFDRAQRPRLVVAVSTRVCCHIKGVVSFHAPVGDISPIVWVVRLFVRPNRDFIIAPRVTRMLTDGSHFRLRVVNILVLWLCIFQGRVLVPLVLNSPHICMQNTGIEQTQLHRCAVKYPAYGARGVCVSNYDAPAPWMPGFLRYRK